MINSHVPNTPTAPSERIVALDALRGLAVLGILIMNIQSYSSIQAAYLNPTAYGDLTGINLWIWTLSHLFAREKFMTIFSILFGAGVLLFAGRLEAKGRSAVGLHYRRTLWLIVIGMIHAYVLWYGDILVAYGLCGLVVFLFRKLSPKWLLALGIVAVAMGSLIFIFFGWSIPYWPQDNYQQSLQHWMPSAETIEAEIAAYRGGWLEQMSHRVPASIVMQTFLFLTFMSWRCGGLMLIGMALFKWGVLAAKRSKRFYSILMGVGLGIGVPLVIYGILRDFKADWSYDYSMFIGSQFNYWGSIPMALSYVALVMLICRSGLWEKLVRRFAAVGRMALSNYLLQTVICTTIFYGHGLGLFGRVERGGQILIVFAVWIILLFISPLWLCSFQFGPAEWLWRTLTYLKVQPIRRREG